MATTPIHQGVVLEDTAPAPRVSSRASDGTTSAFAESPREASLKGINLSHFIQPSTRSAPFGGATYADQTDIFNMSFGLDTVNSYVMTTLTEDALGDGVANLRDRKGAIYVQSAGNGFSQYIDAVTGQSAFALRRWRTTS